MGKEFLNIYCPQCGGPANFDIVHQVYRCQYCGGEVELEAVAQSKKEEQESMSQRVMQSAENFELETTNCSGCGTTLVFEKGEAMTNCAFCGRSLVREKYVVSEDAPQSIIPFAVTREEAMQRISEWCSQNSGKEEAKLLKQNMSRLQGYYLPYRLISGASKTRVGKKSASGRFEMQGYVNNAFVDCSNQIDNLILDAMEPYDLSELKEFDFAYVAGHKVKISDLTEEKSVTRLAAETTENYRGKMEKIWKSKALFMLTEVINPAVNLPVLLPVYYISSGNLVAAVNGQTGKVSVRAVKESTYIDIPWWVKGLGVLIFALGATYLAAWLGTRASGDDFFAPFITGALGFIYLIIFACMFESTDKNHKLKVKYREIFNSGEATFRRERGRLVPRDEVLEREISEPVFMQNIGGEPTRVMYKFRSAARTAKMVVTAVVVTFLPVILALFVNGFQFDRIDLSGSAVWFCIALPVVPIYLIIFGVKNIYDEPWIYTFKEDGSLKRCRTGLGLRDIPLVARMLLKPRTLILALVALGVLAIMVYLTAFGG